MVLQLFDACSTSFLIDALKAAGNDTDSEAIQRALVFVSRCQNLESSHNTTPFSAKVNDGGFYYTPAAGGSSMAGEEANEDPFESLIRAEQIMLQLDEFNPDKQDYSAEIERVAELENELALVDDFLSQFVDVDSAVLARPFAGKAIQLTDVTFGPIDFYVPGVISLLLQHIAITLAALDIVRERVGGSIELFRAAPIN